ncbi:ankyrin repeat domain-containing protein [Candidatus Dependentiae bacterium]
MFLKIWGKFTFFLCIFFAFFVMYTPSRAMNKETTKLSDKEQRELNKKLLKRCGCEYGRDFADEIFVREDTEAWPFFSCRGTNFKKVKSFIEKGAKINCQDKYGYTPLHKAMKIGDFWVAKYLVENGADINIKDSKKGKTSLEFAYKRNIDIFMLMCKKYDEVQPSHFGCPLNRAISHGEKKYRFDYIVFLLKKGCDVNQQDSLGETSLHCAVKIKDMNIVKYLVEKGAKIDVADKKGITPLHLAVSIKSKDIVVYLLEKKAKVNVIDMEGETPIFKIITDPYENRGKHDFLGIVKLLCKNGAKVDIKNKKENSLIWTVMVGECFLSCPKSLFEVAKCLEKKGAKLDVNKRFCKNRFSSLDAYVEVNKKFCKDKLTLLHEAVIEQNVEKAKYLLSRGADIEAKNIYGHTPLVYAVYFGGRSVGGDREGGIPIIDYLLKHGANMYTVDNKKNNILHITALATVDSKHFTMAKWFIDKGVSLNSKNAKGYTVIDVAARCKSGFSRLEFIVYLFTQAIAQDLKEKQPNYIKKLAEKLLNGRTLFLYDRYPGLVMPCVYEQSTFKNMFCLEAKRKNASLELIKYFLKFGFKIGKGDNQYTPLYYAIKYKQKLDFVKLLFEKSNKIEKETMDMLIKKKKKYVGLFCKKEDKCPICLDNFKSKQFVWLIEACKHFFCKDCIEKWEAININQENKQAPCPMCRKKFTHDGLKKRIFLRQENLLKKKR